ncbi:MAG TPA: hypothetical protein VFI02_10925 [Armatimonadota bacterium]|nr:hypothetical protein [Armatimonadota bacterium]
MISRRIILLAAVGIIVFSVASGCGKSRTASGPQDQVYSLDRTISDYKTALGGPQAGQNKQAQDAELTRLKGIWDGKLVSGTVIVDEVRESAVRTDNECPLIISAHVDTNSGDPVKIVVQVPADFVGRVQKLPIGSPVSVLCRVAYFPIGYRLVELH